MARKSPRKTIPHTIPFLETFDETFDVGVDTRTGVEDKDYQPPFRFTGKIDKLTVKLVAIECRGGKAAPAKGPGDEKQGPVNRSASVAVALGFRPLNLNPRAARPPNKPGEIGEK